MIWGILWVGSCTGWPHSAPSELLQVGKKATGYSLGGPVPSWVGLDVIFDWIAAGEKGKGCENH